MIHKNIEWHDIPEASIMSEVTRMEVHFAAMHWTYRLMRDQFGEWQIYVTNPDGTHVVFAQGKAACQPIATMMGIVLC